MKTILLLAFLIGNCISVSINIAKRCSCNEFDSTLCAAATYCTVIDGICSPNQCKSLQSSECTAFSSEFKCKWNELTNVCEDYEYKCSDFDGSYLCSVNMFRLGCYLDSTTDTCKTYGACTSAKNVYECDILNCAYSLAEGCQDPYSLSTCDGTDKTSCSAWDGEGTVCAMNDKNECKQTDIFRSSCSDYDDYISQCGVPTCKIDLGTQKCIEKTCSDFATEDTCSYLTNIMDFTVTPCIWSNSSCQVATDQDLQDMGVMCVAVTYLNYKWDSDSGKCSACESTEDNPLFSFMKEYADKFNSYSIILDVILISSIMLN